MCRLNRLEFITHFLVAIAFLALTGCATLPKNFERPESYAFTDTEDTLLGKAHKDEMRKHPDNASMLAQLASKMAR